MSLFRVMGIPLQLVLMATTQAQDAPASSTGTVPIGLNLVPALTEKQMVIDQAFLCLFRRTGVLLQSVLIASIDGETIGDYSGISPL